MRACQITSPPVFAALERLYISENSTILLSLSLDLSAGIPLMGSMLGNWPSFDPHNFSQLCPSDPSNPSRMTPITYHPTHDQTLLPPDQVISSEAKNILLRRFYQRAEEKLRPKRAASENLAPEQACKHHRAASSDATL